MYQIYNEDCLEGMKRRVIAESVDLILSDPPYGVSSDCKWDKRLSPDKLFNEYNRIIKPDGAIILTATQPYATDLINANRKYFRYDIVWEKTMAVGFANCKKMPMRAHELILVFYKRLPTYNPQGLVKLDAPLKLKKRAVSTEWVYDQKSLGNEYEREYINYPRSVVKYGNPNSGSLHPTQKPLELFRYLVLTYTNAGDTVLDSCMGSGTTGAACMQTGRRFIGFETEERYFEIAKKRIEEANEELAT